MPPTLGISPLWEALGMVLDNNPPNHSPPKNILDLVNNNQLQISFNYVHMGMNTDNLSHNNFNSYEQELSDYIPQMPFEDEYSQLTPYEERK